MDVSMMCVGAIAGAYGVKGEVRLKSYTSTAEDIANYAPLVTEDGQSYDLVLTGRIKNGLTARLSGIVTKEQADTAKGTKLYVPRDRLPETDDDEYYYQDLIGLTVKDTGGTELGKVHAVLNHGAGDLLEVRGPNLKSGALIPFTQEIVPTVDIENGIIITDPPEGLL